jgi:hypothetical protein
MVFDYRAVEVYNNVLTGESCDIITSKVLNLKDKWKTLISNNKQARYNIGISAYSINFSLGGRNRERDVNGGFKIGEFESMQHHQKLMMGKCKELCEDNFKYMDLEFPGVGNLLEENLSKIIGKPCKFHPQGTYFGFVIQHGYVGHDDGMGWHYDDIARFFISGLVDTSTIIDQYSFTLGVSTPEYASFDWYEQTLSEYPSNTWAKADRPCLEHTNSGFEGGCKNPNCPFESGEFGEMSTVQLNTGSLILQRGRFFHRPGPSIFNEGESRMTIQVFGADIGDMVWLYR